MDKSHSSKLDSVDGAPDHQLALTLDQLMSIVGPAMVRSLVALPGAHFDLPAQKPSDIFVRRYTGGTRPWNPFHHDSAAVTVNVALCDDGTFEGGRLVAVCNGSVQTIERREGEATVHDSRLLHAVTRTTSGVRYSLIVFFGQASDAVGESAREKAAFEAFLASRPAAERVKLVRELDAAEGPLMARLEKQNAVLAKAKAKAPPARAAIEQARAEEAAAAEELLAAQQRLQASRKKLGDALRDAQAAREAAFGEEVTAQQLRVELAAVQAETKARLMQRFGENLREASSRIAKDSAEAAAARIEAIKFLD